VTGPVPSPGAASGPAPGADRLQAAFAVLGFSIALGTGQLALPLLALAAGYDAAVVGVFAAISAVAQVGFRLALPWLLRRVPDRRLMTAACLMIVSSYAVLLGSTALVAFVVAQLLQGSARALFWTSSQTHAVRGPGASVVSLARVQLVGNIGTLTGPAVAGVLSGISLDLALVLGIATGSVGTAFSLATHHLDPFARERRQTGQGRIWRRDGVDVGCWASFTAGGWRALLGSYFPVVLTAAGLGPSAVGAIIALADAASFGAAAVLSRWTLGATRTVIEVSVLATVAGVVGMPLVAGQPILAALVITIGGAGAGMLLTMGPAIASDAVGPDERGDAIAAAGTFRAGALFATPAAIAASLAVVSLPIGVGLAGVMLGLPTLASGLRSRHGRVGVG
jgi:hypothetical protein